MGKWDLFLVVCKQEYCIPVNVLYLPELCFYHLFRAVTNNYAGEKWDSRNSHVGESRLKHLWVRIYHRSQIKI